MFQQCLVLHASDLPKNRGWSPHVWSILNGENDITLSLLEAEDKVDMGRIWKKAKIKLNGTELYDEINQKLFEGELQLISWACKNLSCVTPTQQDSSAANYLPKRTAKDSELDISKSLESQFDLLRVCDPNRFPAFFAVSTASRISSSLAMPVEIIIGLPVLATYSIRGKSMASNEAILYAGAPSSSKKSTAVKSNGELKIVIPSSLALCSKRHRRR